MDGAGAGEDVGYVGCVGLPLQAIPYDACSLRHDRAVNRSRFSQAIDSIEEMAVAGETRCNTLPFGNSLRVELLRVFMKLQYLGDARDAFRWDLLHWMCTRSSPCFRELVFVPMLTPDVQASTPMWCMCARIPEEIEDWNQDDAGGCLADRRAH